MKDWTYLFKPDGDWPVNYRAGVSISTFRAGIILSLRFSESNSWRGVHLTREVALQLHTQLGKHLEIES